MSYRMSQGLREALEFVAIDCSIMDPHTAASKLERILGGTINDDTQRVEYPTKRPSRTPYVKCDGSNQPPITEAGECQVCGRAFTLSVSGYVPRHRDLKRE